MTRKEFSDWKQKAANITDDWKMDRITFLNQKDILIYKGGENGIYLEIKNDGTATIGNYEGALPHIKDALFIPKHSRKVSDNSEAALKYVTERMGLEFFMNINEL